MLKGYHIHHILHTVIKTRGGHTIITTEEGKTSALMLGHTLSQCMSADIGLGSDLCVQCMLPQVLAVQSSHDYFAGTQWGHLVMLALLHGVP